MAVKKFVVTVDSYYLRKMMVFKPAGFKNLPDAESEEHMRLYMDDKNWVYLRHDAFLGIYDWCDTDTEGLKKYIAAKHGLCPEVICTIEV